MARQSLLTSLDQSLLAIAKAMSSRAQEFVCVSRALDKVLLIIGLHTPPLSMKQLASLLGVTSGAATQHVTALEEAGLTRRAPNPSNRRETCIYLTGKGKETLKQIRSRHQQMLQAVFNGLDDGELAELVRLIDKASTTLREKTHV